MNLLKKLLNVFKSDEQPLKITENYTFMPKQASMIRYVNEQCILLLPSDVPNGVALTTEIHEIVVPFSFNVDREYLVNCIKAIPISDNIFYIPNSIAIIPLEITWSILIGVRKRGINTDPVKSALFYDALCRTNDVLSRSIQ